ncbi:MAG: hypothetical protein GY786_01370 [Proteobacteria bacterium]|nr:hypothetical protein [Pseudomonadota bacterium]
MDCAKDFDNNGCRGGLPSHAFEYIHYYGLSLSSNYRYTARDGKCRYVEDMRVGEVEKGSFNIT